MKQKLSEQEKRIETGIVQFGDDWPGIFIRGDSALHYSMHLEFIKQFLIKKELDFSERLILKSIDNLIEMFQSCDITNQK